jgi:hypothetical protein
MTTANGPSTSVAISADGEWVLFRSEATNFVSGVTDSNNTNDVFLYQRSTGAVSLVSRSVASTTTTANSSSFPAAISANGEWLLFSSSASNIVSGVTDSNGSKQDVFLYQRDTGATSLVSRSAALATMTANQGSAPTAISADGEWVLFRSEATNLVPGVTDGNGVANDVFLYQRSTGTLTLVSRSAVSATTTANGASLPTAISADGEWVLFQSAANDLVSGVTDSGGGDDVFLYQRSTGTVSLVSRSAASATTTANGISEATAISADGERVLFRSNATNLVSGLTDSNQTLDVFLYHRSTGAVSLVSRSAASATATANNRSSATAISADGEWVLFSSFATNLVPGVTDINGAANDVFLFQRSTGAVSLVSRSANSATTTADSSSVPTAISADGEWVLFSGNASNLVPGGMDSNGTTDVFLYQRSTGTVSLVSRSAASGATTANTTSSATAISADGERVLFSSFATNLVPGFIDRNGGLQQDVFLYQRGSGLVNLVSRSLGSATATANGNSIAAAISADGNWVLFYSFAGDVVSGVLDGNSADDAFLARVARPDGVFADGFESPPPGTTAPANAP